MNFYFRIYLLHIQPILGKVVNYREIREQGYSEDPCGTGFCRKFLMRLLRIYFTDKFNELALFIEGEKSNILRMF